MKPKYLNIEYTYIDCEFEYNGNDYHLRACIDKDGKVVDDKNNPDYSKDEPGSDTYNDTHYCIYFTVGKELQFELVFYRDPDGADDPFNPCVGNNDTSFLEYINVWEGTECDALTETIQVDDIDLTIR